MVDHQVGAGDVDVWVCSESVGASDAIVHEALGRYPGLSTAATRHDRDAQGRPVVRGRDDLRVSVSNSGGLVLVAVGVLCRVGVDIERVVDRGLVRLRYHALTNAELAELESHDPSQQAAALLGYWTRKEALLKAVGLGLAVDPRLIELPPDHGTPHPIVVPESLGRPSEWWIVSLGLEGYVAAVATDARPPNVRVRELRMVS